MPYVRRWMVRPSPPANRQATFTSTFVTERSVPFAVTCRIYEGNVKQTNLELYVGCGMAFLTRRRPLVENQRRSSRQIFRCGPCLCDALCRSDRIGVFLRSSAVLYSSHRPGSKDKIDARIPSCSLQYHLIYLISLYTCLLYIVLFVKSTQFKFRVA